LRWADGEVGLITRQVRDQADNRLLNHKERGCVMGILHIDHPLSEAEEQKEERRVERKYRITMSLVFGIPTLAIALIVAYTIHLFLRTT
jgi:hypothetical protein